MIHGLARRARLLLICLALAGTVAATAWFADRYYAAITGPAWVIDGDSLAVAGIEIRIEGIDAPELHQTCMRAGKPWSCGSDAAQALRNATAGKEVVCRLRDRDRYGRTVATCQAAGLDLGAAMVKGGFAVSHGSYRADERDARDARRGIWASSFEDPAAWRARHPRPPQ